MDVSIIIVNYNTEDILKQCLESIIEKTQDIVYEIIVVDNASIDNSCIMIRNIFPQVRLIESELNIGFGQANNLAFQIAGGDYFFLLNPDTVLLNNAVLIFYNFMKAKNQNLSIGEIGALGAQLLDKNEKPTFSYGEFPTIISVSRYIKKKITEKLNINSKTALQLSKTPYISVDYITGADLFIPKSIFEQIGGFDSQFFMYYEETDLQKRMAEKGLQRLIISGPRIIHLEGESIASPFKFSYSRFALSEKSFHIYIHKHFNLINNILFRIFIILIRLTIIFERRFTFTEKMKALKVIFSVN